MVSLLKSKKGGIPAVNEIVQIVMGVLPTPIKIIIFILLITTIASFIIPLFLGMFGYACITEGDDISLYQVPMIKFLSKTAFDIERTATDFFTPRDYQFPEDVHPSGDKTYAKIPDECYVTRNVNGTSAIVTGYQGGCTDCEVYRDGFVETFLYVNHFETFCISDGEDEWSATVIKNCDICEPKYPYYYNHSECINTFQQDQCYFTIIDPALETIINENYADLVYRDNIVELGGVVRPQDDSEFVNIQCVDDDTPSLFVFSFEVFNRLMWVYLIIGSALVGFAMKYYAMYS